MGITYKGNYIVHSDDWGRPGGAPSDEFEILLEDIYERNESSEHN